MRKTQIDNFNNTEIYGQIIGCHGDPVNQDTGNNGITIAQALELLNISSIDTQNQILLWSRILVCELLLPNDISIQKSHIALVLRPRNLWLFKDNANYKDFFDGQATAAEISTKFTKISPRYRIGDIIRIGTLPNTITINGWSDGFYSYTNNGLNTAITCGSISLNTSAAILNGRFSSVNLDKIIYYDKNVDSRNRISIPTAAGGSYKGTWSPLASYKTGDVVRILAEGATQGVWAAVKDTTPGIAPSFPEPVIAARYWELVAFGVKSETVFQNGLKTRFFNGRDPE